MVVVLFALIELGFGGAGVVELIAWSLGYVRGSYHNRVVLTFLFAHGVFLAGICYANLRRNASDVWIVVGIVTAILMVYLMPNLLTAG